MKTKNNKELIRLILVKSRQLCKTIKSRPPKRGRPPTYPDHIILFALLLKALENLSLRDLEQRLKDIFPNAPDHTTLWYRFRKIENSCLKELIHTTAREIMRELKAREFHCLIADGTGFGYSDTFRLLWMKGKEIRQVRSHVKTEVLVGVVKGKAVVVGVNTGRAYSDECRLLSTMLRNIKFRARYFLGDAYYGKVDILREVKRLNMYAIVPVRDTTHTRVRHSIRLWAKCNYESRRKVYKRNRYRVEQVIGIVKNRFGDRDCVRDFHTASLYVLARFALYNLILLYRLLLLCLNLLRAYMSLLAFSLHNSGIFPTGSRMLAKGIPL